MKLRNKKTGQEGNFIINKDHFECVDLDYVPEYRNLAELNKEWEDYKEPKGLNEIDVVLEAIDEYGNNHLFDDKYMDRLKILDIAENKLMAWKRLEDKGFRFKRYKYSDILEGTLGIEAQFDNDGQADKDLDLLFGGRE